MKPLVIYHDHCCDGFGAAFAAWMKFGDEAEYLPMSYGQDVSLLEKIKGRDVYVLDFSFKEEFHNQLIGRCNKFVLLDHHKTAFEELCAGLDSPLVKDGKFELRETVPEEDALYILLDNNKSGALLAWEYFHPGTEVPMMISHIDDRDRWQFKIPGSKEFHAALASFKPWSFEQWKDLLREPTMFNEVQYRDIYKLGSAILRAHEQNVKSVVAGGRRDCVIHIGEFNPSSNFDGESVFSGLATNCPPHLASDVGHELANQSGTFGLCWYQGRDGKAKVSLRSNTPFDVSSIAKQFGGGGHAQAAGFEVEISTLQGWLK